MQQKTLIKIKNREILKKESFDYKVYEVTPSRFIESGKLLEGILETMSAVYEPKIKYDFLTKSIVINDSSPIYYEILYEGKDKKIKFNYVVPDKYTKVLVGKIDKVFRVATVKEREDYFNQFANKYYCKFLQEKHFMFSLNADYRKGALLENLMGVLNNISEDDTVVMQLGIIPLEDQTWKEKWKQANIKNKNGEDLSVNVNPAFYVLDKIFGTADKGWGLFDYVLGVQSDTKEQDKIQKQMDRMMTYKNQHMTTQKISLKGYEVQLKIYCTNHAMVRYYGKIFDSAFKVLDADQQLTISNIGRHKTDKREFSSQVNRNIWSLKEIAHFLELPDRRLQLDYKENLKAIENTENIIPKELTIKGSKIRIGEASYKGNKFMTYYPEEFAMKAMSKIYVGPSRSGKTTAIKHFIIDAIKAGDSVICIDTIKNCETVEDVRDYMPKEYKDKLVILDYTNLHYLLPLDFSELLNVEFKDVIGRMNSASHVTNSLVGFINSISESGSEDQLSPRMKKLLSASGKICLSQPKTTIKTILDVLLYADIRDKYIKSSGISEDNIMVQELRRLDDERTGTNYSLISGIVDRVSVLLNDWATELLISTPSCPEINFTKYANEGKCVLIKMSDQFFDREALKPLVTLLFFKIWNGVAISRSNIDQPKMCHLVLDEVHSFPQIMKFLSSKAKEAAKFALSFVLTSHYLIDMKSLLPNLKAVQANFVMLGGTSRDNLKLLENELLLEGVELTEAMQTKRYHSLNMINYGSQYCVYTGELLGKLDRFYQKEDRSYLDLEFSKKYGVKFDG